MKPIPYYVTSHTTCDVMRSHPVPEATGGPMSKSQVAKLVADGMTKKAAKTALKALASVDASAPAKATAKKATAKKKAAAPAQTVGEALVEKHNYAFSSGRIYATEDVALGIVRVLKTGTPEIVQTS